MTNRFLSNALSVRQISTLILLLLASAFAMASHHGAGQHHKRHVFADFDLNEDGAIVAAEFYEVRATHMAERAKAGGKMKNAKTAPTFESIDLDDDGKISADEFAAHHDKMKQEKKKKSSKSSK